MFRAGMKKELGQNFIFNEYICKNIVDAAGDLKNKIVVEIGPGAGGLTLEILRRNVKKLYIVEYDQHWVNVWTNLSQYSNGTLEVIHADALRFDISSLKPQVVISNLPYNISTQLLYKWFNNFSSFERLVLMFQKEVADRRIAQPKTKAYGQMSVLSQWLSNIEKVCDLEPEDFSPPPKVKSSVLKFAPYKKIEHSELYDDFMRFLTKAFSQRRKVIRKNIANDKTFNELLQMGYLENTRAEEISVSDYVKLITRIMD